MHNNVWTFGYVLVIRRHAKHDFNNWQYRPRKHLLLFLRWQVSLRWQSRSIFYCQIIILEIDRNKNTLLDKSVILRILYLNRISLGKHCYMLFAIKTNTVIYSTTFICYIIIITKNLISLLSLYFIKKRATTQCEIWMFCGCTGEH